MKKESTEQRGESYKVDDGGKLYFVKYSNSMDMWWTPTFDPFNSHDPRLHNVTEIMRLRANNEIICPHVKISYLNHLP